MQKHVINIKHYSDFKLRLNGFSLDIFMEIHEFRTVISYLATIFEYYSVYFSYFLVATY